AARPVAGAPAADVVVGDSCHRTPSASRWRVGPDGTTSGSSCTAVAPALRASSTRRTAASAAARSCRRRSGRAAGAQVPPHDAAPAWSSPRGVVGPLPAAYLPSKPSGLLRWVTIPPPRPGAIGAVRGSPSRRQVDHSLAAAEAHRYRTW